MKKWLQLHQLQFIGSESDDNDFDGGDTGQTDYGDSESDSD